MKNLNLLDEIIKFAAEREALLLEEYIKESVLPKICPGATALMQVLTYGVGETYRRRIFYCSKCKDKIGDCEFTITCC